MRRTARLLAPYWSVLLAIVAACTALLGWVKGAALFGVPLSSPDSVEDWAAVLGFAFGIPAAVLALFTYIQSVREQARANLWKRREYLAARFDHLEALPSCRAAMRMLDYNATYLVLDGLRGQVINDKMVMSALAPHQRRGTYTPSEQIIRDAFDTFFTELDRLGAMAAADLVEVEDLRAYVDYWLALFDPSQRGRPPAYGAILRRYVRVFHFQALGELLQARGLMRTSGPSAKQQATADDVLIAEFDSNWVAPLKQEWEQRIESVEASS